MKPERERERELSPEEQFEKLSAGEKAAAIAKHQNEVMVWTGNCRRCGAQISGTLQAIKGKPCHNCGYGGDNGR